MVLVLRPLMFGVAGMWLVDKMEEENRKSGKVNKSRWA